MSHRYMEGTDAGLNPIPEQEPTIEVQGVPVPISMAGKAVARCIRAIQISDKLIQQGFASQEDLKRLRAGLTGEDEDPVSPAEG